jgi:hypothetical protein
MTTQDLDPSATAEQEAPPSPESDGTEQAAPEQDENERERELQRRLTQQGREAAAARQAAAQAQQQANLLNNSVRELQSQVQLLTAHLGEQQREDAVRKQQELDNYLATLPPEERLDRKIQLLGEQVKQLQTAATPSRPVQPPPPEQAAPQHAPISDQQTLDYMRDRAIQIVKEAEQEFGVKVDVSTMSDAEWESEEAFYRGVMKRAARGSQNGDSMPKQTPANETPQQMQTRIRREVEESLGVSSPNGPRPAANGRGKKPTEDDVHSLVNGYSSAKGPKAQVQKLKEMRERMG